MVASLSREHIVRIESTGGAFQVPFSEHGGLISSGLQLFSDIVDAWIQGFGEGVDAVSVTVLSCQD